MKLTISQLLLLFFAISFAQILNAQIIPVQDGSMYSISVGDVEIAVDASFGARIISFKSGGKEILIQGKGMTGSTLWTSPQSEWGWPTLGTTDLDAYSASIIGNKMIFESEEETGISGKKFKFIKSFWANENNNSISIRYSLVNTGSSALSNSLWSVTRVQPEGLTFWKIGDKEPWGSKLPNSFVAEADYHWIEFDEANGTGMKFFTDIGGTGWFGHIARGEYLFIKSFEDVLADDFAPGEAELEYWVDGGVGYVELENQSKYTKVEAGDTLHYDVTWHINKLPADLNAGIGSADLIQFAEEIVATENSTVVDDIFDFDVKLYPNPVRDVLSIRTGNGEMHQSEFSLYNLSGRLVLRQKVEGRADLSLNTLQSGVYFYRIKSSQGEINGKLIKQ